MNNLPKMCYIELNTHPITLDVADIYDAKIKYPSLYIHDIDI